MYKKLCNAGFGVTSLDDLNALLRDWYVKGPTMEYHAGYPGTTGELERKWDEEVDAPKWAARKAKNSGKGRARRKPLLGNQRTTGIDPPYC